MLYGGISKQEFEVFPKNLVQPQLVRIVENNNTTQSAATALQTEIVQLKKYLRVQKNNSEVTLSNLSGAEWERSWGGHRLADRWCWFGNVSDGVDCCQPTAWSISPAARSETKPAPRPCCSCPPSSTSLWTTLSESLCRGMRADCGYRNWVFLLVAPDPHWALGRKLKYLL